MAISVFISTNGPSQWHEHLRQHLAGERCGLSLNEVYLYTGKRAGNAIVDEVQSALREASVLLCILSEGYLTSPWCAWEHFKFVQRRPGNIQFAIPVLAPGLKNWFSGQKDADDELSASLSHELANKVAQVFPNERAQLEEYASAWFTWMRSARHLDLRSITDLEADNIPPNWRGYEPLRTLLDQIKNEVVKSRSPPEEQEAVARLCNLSAFSLGADRFHDGGWGFSLTRTEAFNRDDDDGDVFVRGRYDTNVLVLRALDKFLPGNRLKNEYEAALSGAWNERQPRRKASDRLPRVAQNLASLQSFEAFAPQLVIDMNAIGVELLRERPAHRFMLDDKEQELHASDHHVVMLEFLHRTHRLWQDKEHFKTALQRQNVREEKILNDVTALTGLVETWLGDHNIFSIVSDLDAESHTAADGALVVATLWALLVGNPQGIDLVAAELDRRSALRSRRWTRDCFANFHSATEHLIARAVKSPRQGGSAFVLCLICAYVLERAARGDESTSSLRGHAQTLTSKILRALTAEHGDSIILGCNALGWAAFLLLSNLHQGSTKLAELPLTEMWTLGFNLRMNRAEKLRPKTSSERQDLISRLQNGELQTFIKNEVGSLLNSGSGRYLLRTEGDRDRVAQLLASDAAYWNRRDHEGETESPSPSHCLAGVLRVRSHSKRVELESEGYNRLFLVPFSQITGMNVFDLLGVRRELGEEDNTLVDTMGAVVVLECYAREGKAFTLFPDGFEERTRQITQGLAIPSSLGYGYDDLLKVRRGAQEGYRWVYRTALIQPEFGGALYDNDPTISWRFVEMPDAVETLIQRSPTAVAPKSRVAAPPKKQPRDVKR